MSEKAPMPPWWVIEIPWDDDMEYHVVGGPADNPVTLFVISGESYSNAKELAHLIVQRTKQ